MNKIPVLTVIYHENQTHLDMAIHTWDSFPAECEITAVINKKTKGEYPKNIKYIKNSENCLARAWNIGLKEIFKTHDYAVVSGLDSISPSYTDLVYMIEELKANPEYGIVAAVPHNCVTPYKDIKHGDGSFSFFIISKKAFEQVGKFNEQYKPAYFEDDDYLERLWIEDFKPKRFPHIFYFHVGQGTIKAGEQVRREYGIFMTRNLEIFKKEYGKVPDHLPQNVKFYNGN